MNKDVIYIDVDDDITAIIGKIKNAQEKIVALVPPKRAGALQSAVNLRLLERMAKSSKKQLVLITSNPALMGLAANAQIPVAKNLQSKPELAEVPALVVDDGDDIIDGADLPVGDHAKTAAAMGAAGVAGDIDVSNLDIDGEKVSTATKGAAAKPKKKAKIPNFDSFRKKLIFGIAGGIAVVALLVWMFVFAPAATVVITASTSPSPVSASVRLGGAAPTNYKEGIISSVAQQEKKDAVVEFEATGEKDIGAKATGSMKLTRTSVSSTPISVPAGTRFTASGISFVSTEGTTLAGTSIGPGGIVQDSATVAVQAVAAGTQYNVSSRAYQASVGGFSSQGSTMSGGTTKIAKVVSAEDVERARGQLVGQSTDAERDALKKKFTNGEVVVDGSFVVDRAPAVASPAVDQEAADGKARLTAATTYSIQAVAKTDLESYLKSYLDSKIEADSQKMYSSGADKATLGNYRKDGETQFATLTATGQIGPKIDEAAIKEQVKGKIYGEVQQTLQSIDGVKDVDVKFSYFWVRSVPNDVNKIKIEFKVEQNG